MTPTFSIIVPVYNVEKYLARCVESILRQSYRDFEVILVDDGSNDNSGIICDEFIKKDERVKVIHKENGGVSSARNAGLDICEGKYVGFLDSDDEIISTLFSDMVSYEGFDNCDIAQFDFFYNRHSVGVVEENKKPTVLYGNGVDIAQHFFVSKALYYSVCLKFFRRDIVGERRFDETIQIGEDLKFSYDCCIDSKNVLITDIKGYIYNYREDSVTHKLIKKNSLDIFSVYDYILSCTADDLIITVGVKNSYLKDTVDYFYTLSVDGCLCREDLRVIRKNIFKNLSRIFSFSDRMDYKLLLFGIILCHRIASKICILVNKRKNS